MVEEKRKSSLSAIIPDALDWYIEGLGNLSGKFLKSDYGLQRMLVCEFLGCTLSELRERIKNPADYYLILAFLNEKGEAVRHEMEKVRK
jgi:hypothetical protein